MEGFQFYRPFDSTDFFYERCFLCGADFNKIPRTDEHIFPKWLQHRFNLWHEALIILNKSEIQYRYLTIPCCSTCNNVHLAKMEDKFKALLDKGFENLTIEDEKIIFQWCAKILYGTLYKELSLVLDRKKPDLGAILPPTTMESFRMLHLFLQSIRIETVFNDPRPWSIFIFNYDDDNFDYLNEISLLCFSIKFGKVGIIIAFEDNNALDGYLGLLKKLNKYKLNHIHFYELSARIFYGKKVAINVPLYAVAFNSESQTLSVNTLNSLRNRDWDNEEYAQYFDHILEEKGVTIGRPIFNNGMINSFLINDEGIPYIDLIKASLKEDNGEIEDISKIDSTRETSDTDKIDNPDTNKEDNGENENTGNIDFTGDISSR